MEIVSQLHPPPPGVKLKDHKAIVPTECNSIYASCRVVSKVAKYITEQLVFAHISPNFFKFIYEPQLAKESIVPIQSELVGKHKHKT